MLTAAGSTARQTRLRNVLADQKIDAALITDHRDIYYYTGKNYMGYFPWPACLFIETAGNSWLIGPSADGAAVDECLTYEASTGATMNLDWMDRVAKLARDRFSKVKNVRRLGWTSQTTPGQLRLLLDEIIKPREVVAVDPILHRLQRNKQDADELAVIQAAIHADLAAYDAVQKAIRPGVTELEVLQAGYLGAIAAAGERVIHDGDYQAGGPGGFARNVAIQAGDLYIIDAWTHVRGYWSDLCRTFSVDNKPTDVQQSAYDHVAATHAKISPMFKPGARGTDIAKAVDEHLRQHPVFKDTGLVHHAGHGLGIRVHMDPDLNLLREGILEEGDLVCFEPGGYNNAHRVHIRLENTYQITKSGSRNLVDYPFNLIRKT
ncbi:MAG: aminopeptidase P family protein [Phycisphaeraceae bacterium]|nr:aminopeptidase P family protein [Phycisphaeraceae bacterium]